MILLKVYEFGNDENLAIMLLPGTCCHWKNNFSRVIDLLAEDFFVVCVSYDGFDETEKTEFRDMLTEVAKIEDYIKQRFNGKIHAVYGCSLGGSFVGLMVQRKKIHMEHGILGSSDLDQATRLIAVIQTNLMVLLFYGILHCGRIPRFLRKYMLKKCGEEYTKNVLYMMGVGGVDMSFVTKKSMKNQFYTDLITKLEDNIEVPNTTIHCLYAAKMGEQYKNRYEQHFIRPHIIQHGLLHEELLLCEPNKWIEIVKHCIL
ncbi:alpha/beta fold hydrolase [Clostridium saccharoperbutylacetonicum]|uniref:alpha/beta fold hydrolase n=1 Tax=Clostridium saccharoperbutylacetonicum TaxID=36745 RepID=UPI003002193B